jgi:type IV secretion system protein VirB11
LIAEFNNKEFPRPLVSGMLPQGERVQAVMNPACEHGNIVMCIRRHQMRDMTLESYQSTGAFRELITSPEVDAVTDQLKALYEKRDILGFLQLAITARKNIIISGGTGTGKTTFLNACLKYVPEDQRLITVEDVKEVIVSQPNVARLLYNEDDPQITALKIFQICLRLRPDRIFLSELRGVEIWPYLRAANSGHPGSLTTVHADTPQGCFDQMVFMMQQAGSTSNDARIRDYIRSIIDIVIQLKRCSSSDRFMYVSEIYLKSPLPPFFQRGG